MDDLIRTIERERAWRALLSKEWDGDYQSEASVKAKTIATVTRLYSELATALQQAERLGVRFPT